MINDLFLTLNRKKLLMSEGSDFASGGLLNRLVGNDGCSETADAILEGTFDVDYLKDENRSDIATLMTFVGHMKRPHGDDDTPVDDIHI